MDGGAYDHRMSNYELQNAICEQLRTLVGGSLAFWGNWFGRPYDNFHQVVGADASDDRIVIYFDHAETLIIDRPRAWSLDGGKLVIREAERVRFQWFYYGRTPSRDTLRLEDYRWMNGSPTLMTDFMPDERYSTLDPREPAVALHTP